MNTKRIFGLILGLTMLCAAGLVGCKYNDAAQVPPSEQGQITPPAAGTDEEEEVIQGETGGHYAMPEKLAFTSTALAAAGETGIVATITATVEPADAADKSVDWSVLWDESATLKNNAVTEYLTVAPTSDGSTTATVTCKKSFGNDKIMIKVKTRDGGFEAFCTVSFIGIPTSLIVTTDITSEVQTGGGVSHTYYPLKSNRTTEMTVMLDNGVHDVAESYYEDIEVSLIYPTVTHYLTTSSTETETELANEAFTNVPIKAMISNKKLVIETKDCIEAGYAYMREGNKHGAFVNFAVPSELHGIQIVLKCGELTETVKIKVVSGVTNVTIDSTLKF